MYFRYHIATGEFYDCRGVKPYFIAAGYSGKGLMCNDPGATSMPRMGPIPEGAYHILPSRTHPTLGPVAIPLDPFPTNFMFGRSGFYIHGDNAKGDRSASEGCIILPRNVRDVVETSYLHGRQKCFLVVVRPGTGRKLG